MTAVHSITADDWLKFIRAQADATLDYVAGWLAGCADLPSDSDAMCETLDWLRALIAETPVAGDPDRYSDGRPVVGEVQIESQWLPLRYVWHPDPTHPKNQPQTFRGHVTSSTGRRRAVVISAPGILDVHNIDPPVHLVESGDEP